jgi:SSS family solute:Na+ symporter
LPAPPVLTVVAGVPRWVGTMISALVMTVTFVSGGLLGSTWVNAVQLVVLLCGFIAALPIVLGAAGGISGILANPNVPSTFGDFLHSSGPGSGWTWVIALAPAFIISPGLMQKAYGASSAKAVSRGIGFQAIALAAFAFVPPLFGMAARAIHPGITDPNLVLPTLLVEQLSPALGALALAAVFSAEVNTCDALLFMLSTSLSQDLYKRFLRPQATDAQLLRVARWAAFAGGVGGVLFALRLATVIDALKIFYSLLGVTLLVPGDRRALRSARRLRRSARLDGGRHRDAARRSLCICRALPVDGPDGRRSRRGGNGLWYHTADPRRDTQPFADSTV